jgi:hypothetical protein
MPMSATPNSSGSRERNSPELLLIGPDASAASPLTIAAHSNRRCALQHSFRRASRSNIIFRGVTSFFNEAPGGCILMWIIIGLLSGVILLLWYSLHREEALGAVSTEWLAEYRQDHES